VSKLLRFEDTRINEALDIATSPAIEVGQTQCVLQGGWINEPLLPDPIAIPMSLAASA